MKTAFWNISKLNPKTINQNKRTKCSNYSREPIQIQAINVEVSAYNDWVKLYEYKKIKSWAIN